MLKDVLVDIYMRASIPLTSAPPTVLDPIMVKISQYLEKMDEYFDLALKFRVLIETVLKNGITDKSYSDAKFIKSTFINGTVNSLTLTDKISLVGKIRSVLLNNKFEEDTTFPNDNCSKVKAV